MGSNSLGNMHVLTIRKRHLAQGGRGLNGESRFGWDGLLGQPWLVQLGMSPLASPLAAPVTGDLGEKMFDIFPDATVHCTLLPMRTVSHR